MPSEHPRPWGGSLGSIPGEVGIFWESGNNTHLLTITCVSACMHAGVCVCLCAHSYVLGTCAHVGKDLMYNLSNERPAVLCEAGHLVTFLFRHL